MADYLTGWTPVGFRTSYDPSVSFLNLLAPGNFPLQKARPPSGARFVITGGVAAFWRIKMIIGIVILVLAFTGFLTWIFFKYDLVAAFVTTFVVLALEVIGVVVAFPVYLGASYSCSKVAEKLGVEHDYGFFTGCFVKDESGKWYNYNQQRILK